VAGDPDLPLRPDYWVTTFIDGRQEVAYVDLATGRRVTRQVPRGASVPPSPVAVARSEVRRFREYLDWMIAHRQRQLQFPDPEQNGEDPVPLDRQHAREQRWRRDVKLAWRELLAEFRTREWNQKPLCAPTIDEDVLARRLEAVRRASSYRTCLERLISEAPPGWKRTEADERALRPVERVLKVAWKSPDPQRFDHALEAVAAAFRAAFAAWWDHAGRSRATLRMREWACIAENEEAPQ
jgi:hypothetical protein